MNYQTIEEIYAANDRVRDKFKRTISALTPEQADVLPEGEKWTVGQVVQHVAMVDEGLTRICAKLLSKAEAAGKLSNGRCSISPGFLEKGAQSVNVKLEAPEFVQPAPGVPLSDSISRLDANDAALAELRAKFEEFDGQEAKFPHPYFGDLSAHEWLALRGAHEGRHLVQIRKLVEMIG